MNATEKELMEKDQNRFGRYMIALRKASGLELKEVALLLKVPIQEIHGWELGKTLPSAELVDKIASLYEVSISDFREILEIETSLRLP